jgi:hypothetical protein
MAMVNQLAEALRESVTRQQAFLFVKHRDAGKG